jgi:hypothetical protein
LLTKHVRESVLSKLSTHRSHWPIFFYVVNLNEWRTIEGVTVKDSVARRQLTGLRLLSLLVREQTSTSKKEARMKPCTPYDDTQSDQSPKRDVYAGITAKIVAALEDGVRPWVTPWNAEHAAGRITRPLRHNGQPYTGINILSLWASASVWGFAAPIWMTYRQAGELGAHARKGKKGSPVGYANSITRNETDTDSGVEVARDIHFLKGYTVFNVEQIEGLPAQYTAPGLLRLDVSARIARAECFFGATAATLADGGKRAFYRPSTDSILLLRGLRRRRELLRHPRARDNALDRTRIALGARLWHQVFRVRGLRYRRTRGRTRRRAPLCRS